MTASPFDLRVMALLLRQGRRLNAVSMGLAGLAGLWLVLGAALSLAPGTVVVALLIASLAAAAAQLYCAVRTDLDAELLAALSSQAPAEAARTLDASLQALGLQPESRSGRNWDARWRGARGWIRRQAALAAAQLLLVAAAWLSAA